MQVMAQLKTAEK